jgi:serine protease Do
MSDPLSDSIKPDAMNNDALNTDALNTDALNNDAFTIRPMNPDHASDAGSNGPVDGIESLWNTQPEAVTPVVVDPVVVDPVVVDPVVADPIDAWSLRRDSTSSDHGRWRPMDAAASSDSSVRLSSSAPDPFQPAAWVPVPPTAPVPPIPPVPSVPPIARGRNSFGPFEAEPSPTVTNFPSSLGSSSGAPKSESKQDKTEEPRKQKWAKPALVGGLVGALLSGAASTAAFIATKEKSVASTPTSVVAQPASTTTDTLPQVTFGESTNTGNVIKAAFESVAPAVVSINTKGFDAQNGFGIDPSEGAGSGVVISPDGLVLTNAHVIRGATSIKVTFSDRSVKDAVLIGSIPSNDVALVQVQGVTNLKAARLGNSGSLVIGDQVVAIGNALALEGGPTVTTGIVSALDRDISDQDVSLEGLIQTDAAINPGNSGGPLVNLRGEVVGMNTAIIQNTNNIGFAIAIDRIRPLVDDIKSGKGESTKPKTFLGVTTQTVDTQIRDAYGLATDTGAIVVGVSSGSPAENAGLEPGDVIVKFDGVAVTNNEQLQKAVRAKKANDQVVIEWKRGPQSKTATAVLGQALAR